MQEIEMEDMLNGIHDWLCENMPKTHKKILGMPSSEEMLSIKSITSKYNARDLELFYLYKNPLLRYIFESFGYYFCSRAHFISKQGYVEDSNPDFEMTYVDVGIKKDFIYTDNKILLSESGGRCSTYMDMDPDVNGIIGQIILLDMDNYVALRIADSLNDHIKYFYEGLITGGFSVSLEDGVETLYPNDDYALHNWSVRPRWSKILN